MGIFESIFGKSEETLSQESNAKGEQDASNGEYNPPSRGGLMDTFLGTDEMNDMILGVSHATGF